MSRFLAPRRQGGETVIKDRSEPGVLHGEVAQDQGSQTDLSPSTLPPPPPRSNYREVGLQTGEVFRCIVAAVVRLHPALSELAPLWTGRCRRVVLGVRAGPEATRGSVRDARSRAHPDLPDQTGGPSRGSSRALQLMGVRWGWGTASPPMVPRKPVSVSPPSPPGKGRPPGCCPLSWTPLDSSRLHLLPPV